MVKNAVKRAKLVAPSIKVTKVRKTKSGVVGVRGQAFNSKSPSGMSHVTKAPTRLTGKGGYYDPSR